jgi:hypothetical protein
VPKAQRVGAVHQEVPAERDLHRNPMNSSHCDAALQEDADEAAPGVDDPDRAASYLLDEPSVTWGDDAERGQNDEQDEMSNASH